MSSSKNFGSEKILGLKKYVLRIMFWSNKFNGKEPLLVSNKICLKKIYCKNILGYEKMFGAKKLFGAKNFFI